MMKALRAIFGSKSSDVPKTRKTHPDINLPDPIKGKIIGRAIHPPREGDSTNHLIKGGDKEDPRWLHFYSDRLRDEETKSTVDSIVGEIRRRQKSKLRILGSKPDDKDYK